VARYTYSPGYIDAVAVQERDLNSDDDFGDDDEVVYYHGNTLSSAYCLTDDGENVVERYRYDAYGGCTVLDADGSDDSDNASDVDNPFLFTGRRLDSEWSGMQYRNRSYSTTLGRFVSRDPLEYAGSYSLYDYVVSSPTVVGDPMGLVHITSEEDLGDGRVRMWGEWYWHLETAYPVPTRRLTLSGWTAWEVDQAICLCRRACAWAILDNRTGGWRALEGGWFAQLQEVTISILNEPNVLGSETFRAGSVQQLVAVLEDRTDLETWGVYDTMASHRFVTKAYWSVARGLDVLESTPRTSEYWWLRNSRRYEVSLYNEAALMSGPRVPGPSEQMGHPRQSGAAMLQPLGNAPADIRLAHDAPRKVMRKCAVACNELNKDGDE
jgi:RHS repeat-associated protein